MSSQQKVLTVTQMFSGNLQEMLGEGYIFNPENGNSSHKNFLKPLELPRKSSLKIFCCCCFCFVLFCFVTPWSNQVLTGIQRKNSGHEACSRSTCDGPLHNCFVQILRWNTYWTALPVPLCPLLFFYLPRSPRERRTVLQLSAQLRGCSGQGVAPEGACHKPGIYGPSALRRERKEAKQHPDGTDRRGPVM